MLNLVFSFYSVGPGEGTQVTRGDGIFLYLLTHLTGTAYVDIFWIEDEIPLVVKIVKFLIRVWWF